MPVGSESSPLDLPLDEVTVTVYDTHSLACDNIALLCLISSW